jgi:hypothetical protein
MATSACGGASSAEGSGGSAGSANGTGAAASSSGGSGGVNGSANGSATTGPRFQGSGTGYLPLTPGCGPDTANQCAGTCEAHAVFDPGSVIRAPATLCFGGSADPTPDDPLATIEQVIEVVGGKRIVHLRITFDPAFVDNTYGANACCGWPGTDGSTSTDTSAAPPPGMMSGMMPGMAPGMMPGMKPGKGGHTFDDLVGSDHVELLLTDAAGNTIMDFDVDYISQNSGSCGYGTLGVSGAEGKVIKGNAAAVLGVATSLDRNLNGCGYCYTTDSPATDASYTPNPATPAWDYRVVYEVWLDLDAFGSAGFGQAYITNVHASPSKLSSNTVEVTASPCPADWDTPGASCPQNYTVYVESEGKSSCVPIPFSNYPNMQPCPDGYELDTATEGKYCVPK